MHYVSYFSHFKRSERKENYLSHAGVFKRNHVLLVVTRSHLCDEFCKEPSRFAYISSKSL